MALLLASAAYDPATAVTVSSTSLTAMTAFDTTNLRLTFTAPSSGIVLVRARVPFGGTTGNSPNVLLGVLDGSAIKMRVVGFGTDAAPLTVNASNTASTEAIGYVSGLTGGNSYTWDLAYSVDVVGGTSSTMRYGGPNNNSGSNAYGAITFEVWDPGSSLLSAILYDPTTAASKSTALSAMTALDTSNLRATFTAPASGKVLWRIRTVIGSANVSPIPSVLLGILESSTVVARQACAISNAGGTGSSFPSFVHDASGLVTGVSAGSHSWDAAWAIQLAGGSANYKLRYGGPDDTTTNNAWGGCLFELYAA
jgi:hypothetical protein